MAIAVAVNQSEVVPSLDELIETINREHGVAQLHGMKALEHAIICGEALIMAKSLVPKGEFMQWCRENFNGSLGSVWRYTKIARRRAEIEANPEVKGIFSAIESVVDTPQVKRSTHRPSGQRIGAKLTRDEIQTACELRANGMKFREVADTLGVSAPAVLRAVNPDARARHKARASRERAIRNLGRKAINSADLDRAARSSGISDIWASLHRIGEQMDAYARDTGATPALRAAVGDALKDHYRCRDKISAVLAQA